MIDATFYDIRDPFSFRIRNLICYKVFICVQEIMTIGIGNTPNVTDKFIKITNNKLFKYDFKLFSREPTNLRRVCICQMQYLTFVELLIIKLLSLWHYFTTCSV